MICAETWQVRCPKCASEDRIDVEIKTMARFTSSGTDATESACGDHEWDGDSFCTCAACGHAGLAREFATELEG